MTIVNMSEKYLQKVGQNVRHPAIAMKIPV